MISPVNAVEPAPLTNLTRKQYILRIGVLGWGVPVAILFSIIQGFEYGWDEFLPRLIPALILFPIGGIFFGMFMWWTLQRKQARVLEAKLRE